MSSCKVDAVFLNGNFYVFRFRFRYKLPELELSQDIIPVFRDDVQLSVTEYRTKLYDIMTANEKIGGIGHKMDKK